MHRRSFLKTTLAGIACGWETAQGAQAPPKTKLGLVLYSYGIRSRNDASNEFGKPLNFLKFASERGASAVQLPLGIRDADQCRLIRQLAEQCQVAVEGSVAPPGDGPQEQERFDEELRTARACGADVVRMVMLGGRRYEVFRRAEEYQDFARRATTALGKAEPIAAKHRVRLAVENHKDFRSQELIDVIKQISSEWVGICLDTGNNLALLEEPHETVSALAPYTFTVHLKDIGVEEIEQGFLMTEVPLGDGCLDLVAMVRTIRRAHPEARFHLEMITRDPLVIACLEESYWATMKDVSGWELARTLAFVRRHAGRTRLPRLSTMSLEEQLRLEEHNVIRSFRYVAEHHLLDV
jgi:sugar phosphate isomerase/epimerase